MIGIYKITNLKNNKVYIGQSVNIKERWRCERSRPFQKRSQEYNSPLCRAIRKYSLKNFKFEIIEECSIDELDEREVYYIDMYRSSQEEYGYNLTDGGGGSRGHGRLTSHEVEEIKYLLQKEKISQLKIAEKYHVSKDTVSSINTGRFRYDPKLHYPLRRRQENLSHCAICGAEITRKARICAECSKRQQRKVERPDVETLQHDIIMLGFTGTGRKYGVTGNSIKNWCKSYGMSTMAADYRS